MDATIAQSAGAPTIVSKHWRRCGPALAVQSLADDHLALALAAAAAAAAAVAVAVAADAVAAAAAVAMTAAAAAAMTAAVAVVVAEALRELRRQLQVSLRVAVPNRLVQLVAIMPAKKM